ncbi:helix-turn-helix domain-containing protein [Nakamurella sp. YIM 132087]|uniref:Helix-turn-helix domain-containing protein n=1 Tax=Nakamurella alba TaxID=2665158 RepID=A0A7K1FM70_9ACTN|nr:AraC family transcriptional regulator [Nakamurella alba]MTD14333.1 helix-turn-helix domain-containing protein [Nakamurella alba]
MDTITAVLDGHAARRPFLLRCVFTPPWGIRLADHATLGLVVVAAGTVVVSGIDHAPVRLGPGDVLITAAAADLDLTDAETSEVDAVVEPGQVCRTLPGRPPVTFLGPGHTDWGNDPAGSTVLLTATWELPGQVSGRLVGSLPPGTVIRTHRADTADTAAGADRSGRSDGSAGSDGELPALLRLLATEMAATSPGRTAVLDRLADLVLIAALRHHWQRPGATVPTWWQAQEDPVLGPALAAMSADPAAEWSVASLAATAHVSRATLSRRFAAVLGTSPMAHLRRWRLDLAADRLRHSTDPVGAVAAAAGFSDPFAFSTAFRREFGRSPRDYRSAGPADAPRISGPARARPSGTP